MNKLLTELLTLEQLQQLLIEVAESKIEFVEQPYLIRLSSILNSDSASLLDTLIGIKDYLKECKALGVHHPNLKFPPQVSESHPLLLAKAGLVINHAMGELSLNETDSEDKYGAIYRGEQRRKIKKSKMDPALTKKFNDTIYTHYTSKGQQDAVRVALTAKSDSTIFVNLPTGSGKTLVAHSCMLFSHPRQLSIVIVPTVGLAIEQGKRAKEVFQQADGNSVNEYSWHSGLLKSDKEQMRNNIDEGMQRVIFTSPESITTTLLPHMFRLADKGLLANIIIDEAHLIDSWGSNFRSEFQRFSALVTSLRKVTKKPFKTILMSATFTQDNIDSFTKLFAEPSTEPIIINSAYLRPEIETRYTKVTEEDHIEVVIKNINELPRPLIVYTTKVKDCESLYQKLRLLGYSRCGIFNGKTDNDDRKQVIDQWIGNELDIIVATSAFGVGMDKSDVRSILHTSVPDNLDRYYQEIGRSGRDGSASTSLVVFHESQFETAKSINQSKLIDIDKGYRRWMKMWETCTKISAFDINDGTLYKLDISQFHYGLNQKSDRNDDWNWLTLLLMQRSGLLRIYFEKPELKFSDDLTGAERRIQTDLYWNEYKSGIFIEILNDQHATKDLWSSVIFDRRNKEKKAQNKGYEAIRAVLSGEVSLCRSLEKYYKIKQRRPQYACPSCEFCKQQMKPPFLPTLGNNSFVHHYEFPAYQNASLDTYCDFDNLISIYYSDEEVKNNDLFWLELFKTMLERKFIAAIQCEPEIIEELCKLLPQNFPHFWIVQSVDDDTSLWPKLLISKRKEKYIPSIQTNQKTCYFVAEKEQRFEHDIQRRWWEVNNLSVSVNNFKNLVESV